MANISENEIQLQHEFYEDFLPRVDSKLTLEEIQTNYTDGVVNGNLLEFKTTINELNPVLFQAIKYLSSMRVHGKGIPANILLVSVYGKKIYLYHSKDYLENIEAVYIGAASRNNAGFQCGNVIEEIDYGTDSGKERVVELLKTSDYTKINIDENCIVGWAKRYYEERPNARKQDFIGDDTGKVRILGEIRQPNLFARFINPYNLPSNRRFEYLMDKLNDTIQKKNLGAFYTHPLYAEKSLELLRMAIDRVPQGNDYIILDRCAGTGNLERFMTDEELSHTIVSTVEYYEYKVLLEGLGDKVRHIIPPFEEKDTFDAGLVRGADALSEAYIKNEVIMQYVNNDKCTIILFENPPYAETTSAEHQRMNASKKSSEWKKSYLCGRMKEAVKGAGIKHTVTNDLGNLFIWSAFSYYLRQPSDSYIVYSPVKYWKAQHLVNKKLLKGFAFNRKHFHTNTEACIMVALWANIESTVDSFKLSAYNVKEESVVYEGELSVNKIYSTFSELYYDKRPLRDSEKCGILCGLDGREKTDNVTYKPGYGHDIIGYMVAHSSGFDNPDLDSSLLVAGRYDGHGFYLRRDDWLSKMPLFASSRYYGYDNKWTQRGRIMKSADGANDYFSDLEKGKLDFFLRKCLLFTCLEMQNHMREFIGSDGRFYHNQLTLDTTNGETLASMEIAQMDKNSRETDLLKQWDKILTEAKKTKEYNPNYNYGLFQIYKELDTTRMNEKTNKEVQNYPALHGDIRALKPMLKDYYIEEIVPNLFKYQFLK